jgi:hypothetical protein
VVGKQRNTQILVYLPVTYLNDHSLDGPLLYEFLLTSLLCHWLGQIWLAWLAELAPLLGQ